MMGSYRNGNGDLDATGALSTLQQESSRYCSTQSGSIPSPATSFTACRTKFNANNYSSIYSDSTSTVQPSAITLIPQIRY